jgi:hypothetical protein
MADANKLSSERYKFSAQSDRYVLDDVRSKLICIGRLMGKVRCI